MMDWDRDYAVARLAYSSEQYDFLIVGGGATGLGAAVDAAVRGYRVALIEQADFASGTSSRSTKLVHGGLRYLRQGNLPLVREALHERGLLFANAPHLVHDMAFVIPTYRWWERAYYGTGLKLYDAMAGQFGRGPSRLLSRAETLARVPTVRQQGLHGGVLYYDGQFDDARLAITLAQTAVGLGAVVVNYLRAASIVKERGRAIGVEAEDSESGQQFTIRAKVVINATGVFVDALRTNDEAGARSIVTASQGVHIVLPHDFLPGDSALMIPRTADGRVLFAVPWHGHVIVGTTDTPVPAASMEPRPTANEIEFLMTHAARYLSGSPSPADVLSIFAGLRPLVKRGHETHTSALSRDHCIVVSPSGLVSITGGKWTTYRKMAEDVVDRAETVAGFAAHPCHTERLALHGSTREAAREAHLQVYGADASEVRRLMAADPQLSERLHPSLPYQRGEVVWHVRAEMARTVEDVLARRTRMLLLDARASIEAAPRVAAFMARHLKRDTAWEKQQVQAYTALAQGYTFQGVRNDRG